MNINSQAHFAVAPTSIDAQRSQFRQPYDYKTTFDAGRLIPFYVAEVLPGDTHQLKTSKVVRLQTLLRPIMDNIFLDVAYFYVRNDLIWSDFKKFMGERVTPWYDESQPAPVNFPKWKAPASGIPVGSLADYMGLPIGERSANKRFNALPFRAYAKVCADWYTATPVAPVPQIFLGNGDTNADSPGVDVDNNKNVVYGWHPFRVSRLHDLFSSALPSPQLGDPVPISLGKYAPVYPSNNGRLEWSDLLSRGVAPMSGFMYNTSDGLAAKPVRVGTFASSEAISDSVNYTNVPDVPPRSFSPNNLVADMSGVTMTTVNDLRVAFALQRYREKSAIAGSSYGSLLHAHFGISSPDSRLGRSEYLGGSRVPININEVVNTSENDLSGSFLGNLGATSSTADVSDDVVFSADQHGWIIGVMVARYDHSYSQGVEKFWLYDNFDDLYFPEFSNIGEVPLSTDEIYFTGNGDTFGYQEAWYNLRYKQNRVTSEMRPDAPQSLSMWHLGDHYDTQPTLSEGWMLENPDNLDRALAVSHTVSKQFFADIYVVDTITRVLPMFSIPGLRTL